MAEAQPSDANYLAFSPSLLGIPPELRLQVYRYLFDADLVRELYALSTANKRIRSELLSEYPRWFSAKIRSLERHLNPHQDEGVEVSLELVPPTPVMGAHTELQVILAVLERDDPSKIHSYGPDVANRFASIIKTLVPLDVDHIAFTRSILRRTVEWERRFDGRLHYEMKRLLRHDLRVREIAFQRDDCDTWPGASKWAFLRRYEGGWYGKTADDAQGWLASVFWVPKSEADAQALST